MKYLATTVVVFAGIALGSWALMTGTERQAHVDCALWAQQASEYPLFYLVQWQKEECDSIGVTINAPIHGDQ